MAATAFVYHPGNTTAVTISLTSSDGAALAGATASMTLYGADGVTEVSGQSWPADLVESEVSPGWYTGSLDSDLDVDFGDHLKLVVLVAADTTNARWELPVVVLARTG